MTGKPFLPYARQSVDDDDIRAVVEVLRSDRITSGPAIPKFETSLADAVGAEWAVAVSSGTAALHIACAAANVGPGDEVIVPAITFLSTANCARYVGAEPIFADVDPDTGLMDVEAAASRVTPKTRAIVPVHLGGAAADIAAVQRLADGCGALVIEDAAHALGARGTDGGEAIGSCRNGSRMATFSFHPVKHITTGEGGAVTGNDRALLSRLKRLRDHGIERERSSFAEPPPGPWFYEMQELGHNFRMTDIQAALGWSQLRRLDGFLKRRRALASSYDERLRRLADVRPVIAARLVETCAWHLYPVLIEFESHGTTRTAVMEAMTAQGIGTQVHYIPLPMQPYYRHRGWNIDAFPGARRYYERTLSLPLFPAMTDGDVERVVDALACALSGERGGRE